MEDESGYSRPQTMRQVLAENLARLMADRANMNTNPKLFARAGIPVATISRIKNAKVAATIDMVERIAPAFGLEPWQLLVPGLDPKSPQILRNSSPIEEELYSKIRALIESEKVVQSAGRDSGLGELE